jgi:phage tail-like protein
MDRSKAMAEVTQNGYFALYDFILPTPLGDAGTALNFDSCSGGGMTISPIKYNVVSEGGHAAAKQLPGMTTFEPVTLKRSFDNSAKDMFKQFKDFGNLNLNVRKNFSVVMIDPNGEPQAMWHLYNSSPNSISGFSFDQSSTDNYTTFEITLQPEYIELIFL